MTRQPRLFNSEPDANRSGFSEWGTFKDSLRAPIHSWFTYPAGFSHKAVEHYLQLHSAVPQKTVIYDPFMGSGTTNIVAKLGGFSSFGVEAHPFVYPITLSKLTWDIDLASIRRFVSNLDTTADRLSESKIREHNSKKFPELLTKCFLPNTLYELGAIRDKVKKSKLGANEKRFINVALICSLRDVSIAATGWPYIAPKKIKVTSMSKLPIPTLAKRIARMLEDIEWAIEETTTLNSEHHCVLGDSRNSGISSEIADLIFTSPPYLNNFDYADRTRLEMYFMGDAQTWGDISTQVRTRLMTSATTQINRSDPQYELSAEFRSDCPEEATFISEAADELGKRRLTKGGKKSYDFMVIGYFNDIHRILRDSARILKTGGSAAFVLGDSAPYGVHIPTDVLIGKIGTQVGMSEYQIEPLRKRGDKWANNPQRHGVELRETIVHFRK